MSKFGWKMKIHLFSSLHLQTLKHQRSPKHSLFQITLEACWRLFCWNALEVLFKVKCDHGLTIKAFIDFIWRINSLGPLWWFSLYVSHLKRTANKHSLNQGCRLFQKPFKCIFKLLRQPEESMNLLAIMY